MDNFGDSAGVCGLDPAKSPGPAAGSESVEGRIDLVMNINNLNAASELFVTVSESSRARARRSHRVRITEHSAARMTISTAASGPGRARGPSCDGPSLRSARRHGSEFRASSSDSLNISRSLDQRLHWK